MTSALEAWWKVDAALIPHPNGQAVPEAGSWTLDDTAYRVLGVPSRRVTARSRHPCTMWAAPRDIAKNAVRSR